MPLVNSKYLQCFLNDSLWDAGRRKPRDKFCGIPVSPYFSQRVTAAQVPFGFVLCLCQVHPVVQLWVSNGALPSDLGVWWGGHRQLETEGLSSPSSAFCISLLFRLPFSLQNLCAKLTKFSDSQSNQS